MAHDAKGKEFYFIGIYFIVVIGGYFLKKRCA